MDRSKCSKNPAQVIYIHIRVVLATSLLETERLAEKIMNLCSLCYGVETKLKAIPNVQITRPWTANERQTIRYRPKTNMLG